MASVQYDGLALDMPKFGGSGDYSFYFDNTEAFGVLMNSNTDGSQRASHSVRHGDVHHLLPGFHTFRLDDSFVGKNVNVHVVKET